MMKCELCNADPMTVNCNNANCDTGKPDPVSDMFEEMGVTVVDVTPGRDVNQNTTSLNIDTPNVKENQ